MRIILFFSSFYLFIFCIFCLFVVWLGAGDDDITPGQMILEK